MSSKIDVFAQKETIFKYCQNEMSALQQQLAAANEEIAKKSEQLAAATEFAQGETAKVNRLTDENLRIKKIFGVMLQKLGDEREKTPQITEPNSDDEEQFQLYDGASLDISKLNQVAVRREVTQSRSGRV